MPNQPRRRKTASAMTTIGVKIIMAEYAVVTRSAPTSKSGSPGGDGNTAPELAESVISPEKVSSTWARPRVATTPTTVGALRSRRITTTSEPAPTPAETTSAIGSAIQ